MGDEGPRMSLLFGIALLVWGGCSVTTGDGGRVFGIFGKVPAVGWIGWIFLPIGVYICILSIRSLRRGEGKPKKYTDEDAARAKEELDRMYMKEHGSLPEDATRKKDA